MCDVDLDVPAQPKVDPQQPEDNYDADFEEAPTKVTGSHFIVQFVSSSFNYKEELGVPRQMLIPRLRT
jgi:hypothetical protein